MKITKNRIINFVLILFSGIFLFAVWLTYKRNIQTPLTYYHVYITLFYSIVLICAASVGWTLENKLRLILVGSGVLVAVLLSDLSLCIIKLPVQTDKILRERLIHQQGREFDRRNKFEVVAQLQFAGKSAWPNISPEYFVPSEGISTPLQEKIFPVSAGISNVMTVVCNEDGYFSMYQSDEFGFNNPKGLFTQQAVDAVIIGDSFAHGACVNEGEDIASFLRYLGVVKTVNLGSSGVGPLIELATLTEYATPLRPKKVFWLYFEGNDLADLTVESQSAFLLQYLNNGFSQNLITQQALIDQSEINYVNTRKEDFKNLYNPAKAKVSFLGTLKLQNLRHQLGLNREKSTLVSAPHGLFEAILVTAQKRVAAWGGELVFVYLPELARYETRDVVAFNRAHYQPEILGILKKHNIRTIDITSTFEKHQDPLSLFPLGIEGHYTAKGYEIVANELYDEV